jgi:hypothetical protein
MINNLTYVDFKMYIEPEQCQRLADFQEQVSYEYERGWSPNGKKVLGKQQ